MRDEKSKEKLANSKNRQNDRKNSGTKEGEGKETQQNKKTKLEEDEKKMKSGEEKRRKKRRDNRNIVVRINIAPEKIKEKED